MADKKKKSERRKTTEIIKARVTPEEKSSFVAQCKTQGVSVSEAIKAEVFKRPAKPQQLPATAGVDPADLSRLLGHVGKIGSNVNQVARHLNQGNAIDQAMAERLEQAVMAMRDAVLNTLGYDHHRD